MGLFSKKECVRCGKKAGLLTRKKLADGDYLCGDCVDLCSPELTSDDFRNMTLDDVEEHIEEVEEDEDRYENEFHRTRTIRTQMVLKNHDIVYVDDTHGWWVNATRQHPDVFTFSQAGDCHLDLDTTLRSDDNDDDHDHEDFLEDMFRGAAFMQMRMQYPELPVCPPNEEIQKMEFVIYINDRAPITEVRIPVMDAIIPSQGDIEGGYECAYQLLNLFRSMKQKHADYEQAAASQTKAAQPAQAAGGDMTEQLMNLKKLLDAGILTQDEFNAKKKQILGL